jgi:tetratricopeptide (TPR) repeat protein
MSFCMFLRTAAEGASRMPASRIVLSLVFVLAAGVPAALTARERDLLGPLLRLENDHAALCPPAAGDSDHPTGIPTLINDLRSQPKFTEGGPATVDALNRLIFGELAIQASQELKDPCNLLPSRVLERKQGYCVGMAALYLVLAEQLRLPIFAVATPSHVFLRYDDGTTRINIETFQQGANIPDEQYIQEQRIPEESITRGVFMRSLSADEFLAQVHNNLGVVYSERGDFERAATEYRDAIRFDSRFPAALYNYGNDLLKQREFRRAARRFSKSLRLYPTDVWALNNRGLAYMKLGKREKARRGFEEALRIDPGFEQAKRNLQSMQ